MCSTAALFSNRSFRYVGEANVQRSEQMNIFDLDGRNPDQRAVSLAELCSFVDVKFIRCAFVTVLGRQVDPEGQAYYLGKLRAGASKLSILRDLRRSSEGKLHDPGIAGFDRALRRHHNSNRRFIGPILRWLHGDGGSRALEMQLRSLVHQCEAERERAAARAATFNHLLVMLDGRVEEIRRELRASLASQSITPRQISHSEAAGDTEWEHTLQSVLNG
jgi:hypothetical protein